VDVVPPTGKEVVQADYFVTLRDESFTEVGANEARTARYQHLHCMTVQLGITPGDLHRIAAPGKYECQDARQGTYLSVTLVTARSFQVKR
jgi:phosphatidylserine decarboxylase